jgi:hypothetical protein
MRSPLRRLAEVTIGGWHGTKSTLRQCQHERLICSCWKERANAGNPGIGSPSALRAEQRGAWCD